MSQDCLQEHKPVVTLTVRYNVEILRGTQTGNCVQKRLKF
jgi:hypothetical protein